MENTLFDRPMTVINLGLPGLYESVKDQGIPCIHVDWKIPAGGDPRLLRILDRLRELEEEEERNASR